mgnify:CR=1 FL=1
MSIERERVERLGILCHWKSEGEGEYRLFPIEQWTVGICEELNKVPFQDKYKYVLEDVPKVSSEDLILESEIKERFDTLPQNIGICSVKKLYEYSKLPVDFVRFSGTVVLKNYNNKEAVEQCLSSIQEGVDLLYNFNRIKEELLGKEEYRNPIKEYSEENEKSLENLRKICMLSAGFSMTNRPEDNHNVWNELLQNANDHIIDSGTMSICINDTEKTLTLSYPDEGFSVRDFVAISTVGNSANVVVNENREGKKGTGFKSIYSLFQKVEIKSGPVKCTLDDKPVSVQFARDEKGQNEITVKKLNLQGDGDKGKWNYPIPEFEKIQPVDNTTTIKLYLRNDKEISVVYQMIFGSESGTDCTNDEYEKRFIEQKKFLFLTEIKEFSFKLNENSFSFDRETYMGNHYIHWEQDLKLENSEITIQEKWKERSAVFCKKAKVFLLFPKQREELSGEKPVYCTLPVEKFTLTTPFYMNIPLLELNDERKNLQDDKKDWNKTVLQRVMTAIGEIFEYLSSQTSGDIYQANLYQYFPYDYLDDKKIYDDIYWKEALGKYPFIRTHDGNKVQMKCLDDWGGQPIFIFLPDYMYWWFSERKSNECFIIRDDCNTYVYVYYEGTGFFSEDGKENPYYRIREALRKYYKVDVDAVECVMCNNLWDSILNQYIEGLEKKDKTIFETESFCRWLRMMLDSNYYFPEKTNCPRERFCGDNRNNCAGTACSDKKRKIYDLFFRYVRKLDKNKKYHGVTTNVWCTSAGEAYDLTSCYEGKLGDYNSIKPDVESLAEKIYNDKNYKFEHEWSVIRLCFASETDSILISPYVEDTPNKKENPVDCNVAQRMVKWLQNLENKKDGEKILCNQTESFVTWVKGKDKSSSIGEKWKEQAETYRKYGLFFLKQTSDPDSEVIQLSDEVCFSSKPGMCEQKNVILKSSGRENLIQALKSLELIKTDLDDAVKKSDFYKDPENKPTFIEIVLGVYGLDCFDGVYEYLSKQWNKDENPEKGELLLRYYLKMRNMGSTSVLEWDEKYAELLKEMDRETLCPENPKPVFKIKQMSGITIQMMDTFKIRVSSEDAEKKIEKLSNLTLEEVIRQKVHLIQISTGRKHLYCWGKNDKDEDCIIVFGEESFGSMLREVFDCKGYLECRQYGSMRSGPTDQLRKYEINIEESQEKAIRNCAKNISENWRENQEELKRRLIERWDVPYEDQNSAERRQLWIHSPGYGKMKYKNRKCPVCGAILLAEQDLLKIGHITYKPDEKKYIHLPMLMCGNCYKSLSYANDVTLDLGKVDLKLEEKSKSLSSQLCLNDTGIKKVPVVFDMYANETKKLEVNVSFLNRWIWYLLIMGTEQELLP